MQDIKLPVGKNYCKCSGCGEYFGGVSGFDKHRVDRACIHPSAVADKQGKPILTLNNRGYWVRAVNRENWSHL